MPWRWIVAGPNGAGKSTFTGEFLRNLGMPPDRLEGADHGVPDAALQAAPGVFGFLPVEQLLNPAGGGSCGQFASRPLSCTGLARLCNG